MIHIHIYIHTHIYTSTIHTYTSTHQHIRTSTRPHPHIHTTTASKHSHLHTFTPPHLHTYTRTHNHTSTTYTQLTTNHSFITRPDARTSPKNQGALVQQTPSTVSDTTSADCSSNSTGCRTPTLAQAAHCTTHYRMCAHSTGTRTSICSVASLLRFVALFPGFNAVY